MSRVRTVLAVILCLTLALTTSPPAAADTTQPPVIGCLAKQLGLPVGTSPSPFQLLVAQTLTCGGLSSLEGLDQLPSLRSLTLSAVVSPTLDLGGHPLLVSLTIKDSPALQAVVMSGAYPELFSLSFANNPALVTVQVAGTGDPGPFRFTGNPKLKTIQAPAIARPYSSMEFTDNKFADLPSIDHLASRLELREPQLTRVSWPTGPVPTTSLTVIGSRLTTLDIPSSWAQLRSMLVTDNPALTVLSVAPTTTTLTTVDVSRNNLARLSLPLMLRLDSRIDAGNNALADLSGLRAAAIMAPAQRIVLPAGVVGHPTAHGLKPLVGQAIAIQPVGNGSTYYQAVPTPDGVLFTRPGTHTHQFRAVGEGHFFNGTITQKVTGTALPEATFRPAAGFPKLSSDTRGNVSVDLGPMPSGTRTALCEKGGVCGVSTSSLSVVMYQVPGQQPVTSRELYVEFVRKNIVGDLISNRPQRAEILQLTPAGRNAIILLPQSRTVTAPYQARQLPGWTGLKHIVQLRDVNNDRVADQLVANAAGQLLVHKDDKLHPVGTGWQGMDILTNAQHLTGADTHFLIARRKSDGGLFRYTITSTGAVTGAVQIGWRWTGMTSIVGVGDFNRDGIADVQAIRHDGTLWLYLGTRKGELVTGKKVGQGWNGFDKAFSPGDLDGDGVPDLVGLRKDRTLWIYQGRPHYWATPYLVATDVPLDTQLA